MHSWGTQYSNSTQTHFQWDMHLTLLEACVLWQVGAASYLMERFKVPAEQCAHLCDDDNDLELAAIVGRAFVVGITSVSVCCEHTYLSECLLWYLRQRT